MSSKREPYDEPEIVALGDAAAITTEGKSPVTEGAPGSGLYYDASKTGGGPEEEVSVPDEDTSATPEPPPTPDPPPEEPAQ